MDPRGIAPMMAAPQLHAVRGALHITGFDNADLREYERIDHMSEACRGIVLAPENRHG